MERLRSVLTLLPGWLFSGMTIFAILWLTLAPQPLGEQPPPLFQGADKIAHAIMFGTLVVALLLDRQRKHGWTKVGISWIVSGIILSSCLGVLTELAQAAMGLGRSLEFGDMISDSVGSLIAGMAWWMFQNNWSIKNK